MIPISRSPPPPPPPPSPMQENHRRTLSRAPQNPRRRAPPRHCLCQTTPPPLLQPRQCRDLHTRRIYPSRSRQELALPPSFGSAPPSPPATSISAHYRRLPISSGLLSSTPKPLITITGSTQTIPVTGHSTPRPTRSPAKIPPRASPNILFTVHSTPLPPSATSDRPARRTGSPHLLRRRNPTRKALPRLPTRRSSPCLAQLPSPHPLHREDLLSLFWVRIRKPLDTFHICQEVFRVIFFNNNGILSRAPLDLLFGQASQHKLEPTWLSEQKISLPLHGFHN